MKVKIGYKKGKWKLVIEWNESETRQSNEIKGKAKVGNRKVKVGDKIQWKGK